MSRLDKEREQKLQPERLEFAVKEIRDLELEILDITHSRIDFIYKGNVIMFYPYSGWHTGKGIADGRGWKHLKNQIAR